MFSQNDTAIICKGNSFNFDFSAKDIDGDSLAYAFTDAWYASRGNGAQCNGQADAPPYTYVNYVAPFSGSQPLGSNVTIDPATGIVTGIAPGLEGTYVVTCTVTEYKRGTNIIKSSVHKSLHIFVADCSLTQAILKPVYFSCDSLTRSFINEAYGGNIKTYSWDFGVAGTSDDTANIENPSFTYPDTGTYVLKLVVNKNLPCSDSAFSIVKVYPVFSPGFSALGQCKNTPIRFFDNTTSTYGKVDSWSWDFGDGAVSNDTFTLQNPNHYYAIEAIYTVSVTVGNSMGCSGVAVKDILITNKPALELTHDTLICSIDTLQLSAIGQGTVLWGPDYNINNLASAAPLVSPDVPTIYYARLTDPYGCSGTDSVFVDVKQLVTLKTGNDTIVCQSDPMILPLSGDALHYNWTESPPSGSLDDPSLKNPVATPATSTTYRVTGNIGKCIAADNIFIKVVPYPKASAGTDTSICLGTSVQLHATGGSYYSWSPPTFLSSLLVPDPFSVKPVSDIRYTVTVSDVLGCPKSVSSSIQVTVLSVIANAGPSDTTVVLEQPLQLTATGGTTYQWTPPQWLSSNTIAAPVSVPQNDIGYIVKVSNSTGCFDYDSIHVKVYSVAPGIYVPTAFTPNDDGRNDFFRPVALGLKTMDVFRIYNRWGQLLFSDTNIESAGWDGSYKGNKQEPATYVWYAEGTNYRNEKINKRGYVVLIR